MSAIFIGKAENLEADMDSRGILTLKIDTTQKLYRSQSGRNMMISTTHGQDSFTTPDGKVIKINLNMYA